MFNSEPLRETAAPAPRLALAHDTAQQVGASFPRPARLAIVASWFGLASAISLGTGRAVTGTYLAAAVYATELLAAVDANGSKALSGPLTVLATGLTRHQRGIS